MQLNGVERVVLAAVAQGCRSGYEIKALVDKATRFFWAASYGQIYPALRRLEGAGLLEGLDEPQGDRPRRVYALTPAGRKQLAGWLRAPRAGVEVRDEGLLKLFFAGALEPEERLGVLRALRADRERLVERLEALEDEVRETASRYPLLVLDYGLGLHRWQVEWCRQAEAELAGLEEEVTS